MFALYTNTVSAHQLPLARELAARLGAENFRYVYETEPAGGNQETREREPWTMRADESGAAELLESCEVLLAGGLRPTGLFERRVARGLKTLYQTERWFKPLGYLGSSPVPGSLRLLHPGYRRMARRFARLMESPSFQVLPIGPWAERDMKEVFRRFHAGAEFARALVPWGYFVAPGAAAARRVPSDGELKVLWVGRLLDWKRVDTVIDAVAKLRAGGDGPVSLTIVGDGPEKARLERRASRRGGAAVRFVPRVDIRRVRELMREHDIYVLASNAVEGWGAALSEAMEEGMVAFGTEEAGASAALLPEPRRFRSGDVAALARLIAGARGMAPAPMPPDFTAAGAVERLLAVAERMKGEPR